MLYYLVDCLRTYDKTVLSILHIMSTVEVLSIGANLEVYHFFFLFSDTPVSKFGTTLTKRIFPIISSMGQSRQILNEKAPSLRGLNVFHAFEI